MINCRKQQDHSPFLAAMDLEGCLIPEIWIALAQKTGILELKMTTRDIQNYDELMQKRISILDKHGLLLHDIQEVIRGLEPLKGAIEFLKWLRQRVPLVILSDTFYEFSMPLMEKLGFPSLFCHTLKVNSNGQIEGYHSRCTDSKAEAVKGFQQNGFSVIAIGDSHNDLRMLRTANHGILLYPPSSIEENFLDFPSCHSYEELREELKKIWKESPSIKNLFPL